MLTMLTIYYLISKTLSKIGLKGDLTIKIVKTLKTANNSTVWPIYRNVEPSLAIFDSNLG